MPWNEVSAMSLRREFVMLASSQGANLSALCRRFGVSRKTGYKWLARARREEEPALTDRSRRPRHSPARTAPTMEAAILRLRAKHPAWGARKLRARLEAKGRRGLPAVSTITEILRRHGRLDEARSLNQQSPQRFERARPNELWQMDFKGHFAIDTGRCHALGVLDDHSRYNLCLKACQDERRQTVKTALTETFRRYGLPEQMLMDHGPPWGYDPELPIRAWPCGCCGSVSTCFTVGRVIRRPRANRNASIARSTWSYCKADASPRCGRPSGRLTDGVSVTTWSGRTNRSTCGHRSRATNPAFARSPRHFHHWNMPTRTGCCRWDGTGKFTSSTAVSRSPGHCVGNAWPCARSRSTAASGCTTVRLNYVRSISRRVSECVTHVSEHA